MTIQVVAHDLNMLLPILTGAVYLLDGHPHYAGMNEVLDSIYSRIYMARPYRWSPLRKEICS